MGYVESDIWGSRHIGELYSIYGAIRPVILARLAEFKRLGERGSEYDIFKELVFCLLTPQSRAENCWSAVEFLAGNNLLLAGDAATIATALRGVRFRYNKARYIVEARERFMIDGELKLRRFLTDVADPQGVRDWLVRTVKGLGYKEASHLLRNIGLGTNMAILDRHILKNLRILGVIDEIPASMTRKRYLAFERRMMRFACNVSIPLSHLDFVLWYKETGRVFK